MIHELDSAAFPKVYPVFSRMKGVTPVWAMLEGRCPARIFVDHPDHPASTFVWNDVRYKFLAGNAEDHTFIESLAELLDQRLLPEARQSHDPTLVFFLDSPAWQDRISRIVGGRAGIPLVRRRFSLDAARFQAGNWAARIPAGFTVRPLDSETLALSPDLVEMLTIFWRSPEAFFSSGGFGFCITDSNQVVSSCLSALIGVGQAEIDINTHDGYRQRGLATATCAAFIAHCLKNGLAPTWECWLDNTPSLKLAEKLGFRQPVDHPVYFLPPEML